MPRLSTARESLACYDAHIAGLENARQRRWLEVYRDHWWGEVIGDVDMVMATMSRGPIRYTFDGHPFMAGEDLGRITTHAATRAMYQRIVDFGVAIAGPIDEIRVLFDDHGLVVSGILTTVCPGIFLSSHIDPADVEAPHLVRWPNITMVRFDADDLMMGEDCMNGAPLLVRRAGPDIAGSLIDGPLALG